MSFVPKETPGDAPRWGMRWHARKASTAITAGAALTYDLNTSNTVLPATSTSVSIAGISMVSVASTDSDYATAGVLIPMLVPLGNDSVVIATTAGTATGLEGKTCDLTDSLTVNEAATSVNIFLIKKFLTATSVEGVFVNPALSA